MTEKCLYSEIFWSAFSRIRTEYGEIRSISQYSARMREITDQKNSECGHFSRSDKRKHKIASCGISNLAISKCGCKIFLYLRKSNDLFLKNFCLKFLDFINEPSPGLTRLRISVLRLSAQKYFLEYQVKPCVRYSLHSYPENLMIQEIKIYIISANKIVNRR